MYTNEQRKVIDELLEKKRLNPLYKASPEENALVEYVLAWSVREQPYHSHATATQQPRSITKPYAGEYRGSGLGHYKKRRLILRHTCC